MSMLNTSVSHSQRRPGGFWVNWTKMVQIQQVGERPWELSGWEFTWKDDVRQKQKVLMCGPIRVGALSYAVLEEAGPDSPLIVQVDWEGITRFVREKK